MNKKDIIYSSLLGSKVLEQIPRFEAVQNEMMKHVLPPVTFLPFQNETEIAQVEGDYSLNEAEIIKVEEPYAVTVNEDVEFIPENRQFFPFYFVDESGNEAKNFMLPYEPLINISSKNNIVKRNVAKVSAKNARNVQGTIKERWSRDDYQITITGALMGSIMTGDVSQCFPRKYFKKLVDLMCAPKRLKVYCEPLQLLGINYIVIEEFSFPFTKGENVQAYDIKALSDFTHHLLLEIND